MVGGDLCYILAAAQNTAFKDNLQGQILTAPKGNFVRHTYRDIYKVAVAVLLFEHNSRVFFVYSDFY